MKTTREILRTHQPFSTHVDDRSDYVVSFDDALDAMEEYADQFKPKWISVYPVHDINSGRIFILDKSGYICSDRVVGVIASDLLEGNGLTATHYCKIKLPSIPKP